LARQAPVTFVLKADLSQVRETTEVNDTGVGHPLHKSVIDDFEVFKPAEALHLGVAGR
jgi:hypothetical protein